MSPSPRDRARDVALTAAWRAEQQIRSYPRAYALFYRLLTRHPRVRAAVGRAKAGVRGAASTTTRLERVRDRPEVEAARRASVRDRLGLS